MPNRFNGLTCTGGEGGGGTVLDCIYHKMLLEHVSLELIQPCKAFWADKPKVL